MKSHLPLLCALAVLGCASPALAWGDLGHPIICEIAFRELEEGPREQLKVMVGRDPEFRLFADACTWPDDPRRLADEHYLNLPRDANGLGEDPCPLADQCLMTAIPHYCHPPRRRAGAARGAQVPRPLDRRPAPADARLVRR